MVDLSKIIGVFADGNTHYTAMYYQCNGVISLTYGFVTLIQGDIELLDWYTLYHTWTQAVAWQYICSANELLTSQFWHKVYQCIHFLKANKPEIPLKANLSESVVLWCHSLFWKHCVDYCTEIKPQSLINFSSLRFWINVFMAVVDSSLSGDFKKNVSLFSYLSRFCLKKRVIWWYVWYGTEVPSFGI